MAPATRSSRNTALLLALVFPLLVPVGLLTTLSWAYSAFTYDSYDQLAGAGIGTRFSLYGMVLTGALVFFSGIIFAFVWRHAWVIPAVGALLIIALTVLATALMLPRPAGYGG